MLKKGKFQIPVFLLIIMLIMVGCSNKNETASNTNNGNKIENGSPKQGGEAIFAYNTDASNYDPIKGSAGSDHSLLWPIYETLIDFTPELEPSPGLAESWEFKDDKTLILTLRKGVTFQDGSPFNAEAVKFNIERINSKDSNITDLKNVKSVKVIDDQKVKLELSQPDSSILLALSDRGGMMVSPTAVKKYGEDYSQHPTGAGPFEMVKHIPNGEIVYEKFNDYWKENQPYLDKITVKVMADENTRINALKSGEIDFAYNITPSNIQSLKNNQNIELTEKIPVAFRMLYLNTDQGPLKNTAVRKALQYGIDRQALIKAINFGTGEPAYQAFPSGYWAADKDLKVEYNPEKAKELIKESGLKNITIKMNHYSNAYDQRIAEAIKSQLSEIGIQVELQSMELSAAVANFFTEKEVPVFLSSWTGRPDPQMTINNLYSSKSFYNVGGHSTKEIDNLIQKAASTYDKNERAKIYNEISQKGVLDEAIFIPLFFEQKSDAMNKSLKGYTPNMLAKPIFSTTWKR